MIFAATRITALHVQLVFLYGKEVSCLKKLQQIDALFWQKYVAVQEGRALAVASCY